MRGRPITKESIQRQEYVLNLIENEGLTLEKTGELCGGISKQAIEQRLRKDRKSNPRRQESRRKLASIAFLLSLGYPFKDVACIVGTSPVDCRTVAYRKNLRYVTYYKL